MGTLCVTMVTKKDMHTDHYLNLQINHLLEHKRDVVKILAYRARTVVSEREDKRKELEHDRGNECNEYPDCWILPDLRDDNSKEG